ncbi:non-homologous end-joining DNA ligase [Blastococcus saxobsidens]|uniref:DNA ligase (ATP) n=1 Tax=Blastococcus saxobsidens (strain DD2) TaxID=1146883 RepID=H6RPA9_BLASD|nr:non-homologous end-joining DNA ligase [Blastococcus saxobsidens]CCG03968.1 DNA ligase D/DNA polymerase [Blastococcus saxobsidens DD2]
MVAPGPGEVPLPMLAVAGQLPSAGDAAWGYEFKWDGVRAVAAVRDGRLELRSRKGGDISVRYPELAALPPGVDDPGTVVDGEIVVMDEAGRPDFGALQNRMHRTGPEVVRLAAARPVTYLVFDLLAHGGRDLTGLPYAERRSLLDGLTPGGHRWVTTPWFRGGGERVQAASRENELEGVVAKRLDSPYQPGARSPDWRKIKNVRAQSVVVGGWRPGAGRRTGTIGSLLFGVHDDAGRLVYAGHVGTGFTDQALRDLQAVLSPRRTSPFAGALPREITRDAHWVEPELVGEVAFTGWTAEGRLRHPSWRGLRADVDVADVVVEP